MYCILCFILCLISFVTINALSFDVKDCFFINNNTESIELVCAGTNGSYPRSDCFSLFSSTSREIDRAHKIRTLKTGDCRSEGSGYKRFTSIFTNLQVLDISYSRFGDLVRGFEHLEILNASHNGMNSPHNVIPTNLKEIDFSFNEITKLRTKDIFPKRHYLFVMNFSHNRISQISNDYLKHFPDLRFLDLSNNLIESLEKHQFEPITKLEILRLENNPINEYDCDFYLTIRSAAVYMTLNHVWKLNMGCLGPLRVDIDSSDEIIFRVPESKSELRCSKKHFKNIRNLNIAGNLAGNVLQNAPQVIQLLGLQLHTLDISSFPLQTLNMSVFDEFTNLEHLKMSPWYTMGTNCDDILHHFSSAEHSKGLKSLFLEMCPIKKIDCNLFSSIKNSFAVQVSCDQVEEIDTSCLDNALEIDLNRDKCLVLRVPKINTELRCSNDKLYKIQRFNATGNEFKVNLRQIIDMSPPIKVLDAFDRNNSIKRIDCEIFSLHAAANHLNIFWDSVKEIDTSCFNNSIKIDVSDKNDVIFCVTQRDGELRFSKENFKKLTDLNIAGNHLENVTEILQYLGPSIQTLDLASNSLGNLTNQTFNGFVNLRYLSLSHTNLTAFKHEIFILRKLIVLDLSYNRLDYFRLDPFIGSFDELNLLNLEGNDLHYLSFSQFTLPKLSVVGIAKNKFSCLFLDGFLFSNKHLHFIQQIHYNDERVMDCSERNDIIYINADMYNVDKAKGEYWALMILKGENEREYLRKLRFWKYLFLLSITLVCSYLVVKSKLIQKISQTYRSIIPYNSMNTVAYRNETMTPQE